MELQHESLPMKQKLTLSKSINQTSIKKKKKSIMKTEMQNKPIEKCNWSNLNYGGKKRKLEYIL